MCVALKALMEDPSTAAQYMNDPDVGPVLLQVQNIVQNDVNSEDADER